MTNSLLTPKNPDPNTNLIIPLIGWQFVVANMTNIFAGANLIYTTTGGPNNGWYPDMHPAPNDGSSPPLWRLIFTKSGWPAVEIYDTDWFAFDGRMPIRLSASDVNADYNVTIQ